MKFVALSTPILHQLIVGVFLKIVVIMLCEINVAVDAADWPLPIAANSCG